MNKQHIGETRIFHRLRRIARWSLAALSGDRRGSMLSESIVAVVTLTLVGTAVLTGVSTLYISRTTVEGQSTAENLGRNQLEYMSSLPYQDPPTAYPTITPPSGFTVTATAEEYVPGDVTIEKVIVTVTQAEGANLVLETLRAKDTL